MGKRILVGVWMGPLDYPVEMIYDESSKDILVCRELATITLDELLAEVEQSYGKNIRDRLYEELIGAVERFKKKFGLE